MKKICLFIVLFALGLTTVLVTSCQTDERKMAKYAKEFNEFIQKEGLEGYTLLSGDIDLNTLKIVYLTSDERIMVYDLATKENKDITPKNGTIGDTYIGDFSGIYALFPMKDSTDHFDYCKTDGRAFLYTICEDGGLLFYVNTKNATVHYVDKFVKILKDGNAFVASKEVAHFKGEDYSQSYDSKEVEEITIPMTLSDEEYVAARHKREEEDNKRIQEERNRTKEVEIYIRATHPVGKNTQLYETRGCTAHVVGFGGGYENEIVTDLIQVPHGKMWVSKSVTRQSVRPQISYNNGSRGVWYENIPNGTITIRGGQSFRLKVDPYPLNQNSVFRIVFTEVNDY